jgi:hypothetical protein
VHQHAQAQPGAKLRERTADLEIAQVRSEQEHALAAVEHRLYPSLAVKHQIRQADPAVVGHELVEHRLPKLKKVPEAVPAARWAAQTAGLVAPAQELLRRLPLLRLEQEEVQDDGKQHRLERSAPEELVDPEQDDHPARRADLGERRPMRGCCTLGQRALAATLRCNAQPARQEPRSLHQHAKE